MTPEEWPIAAVDAEPTARARAAGRRRLSTVRADFFLNPHERLSEQERALMTAMLHCLVGDIAAEIRASLPSGWTGANDDEPGLIDRLASAGLLDHAELIALLLRRADEARISSAARARNDRRDSAVLHGLVSSTDGAVAAAAMVLIVARGRRRDRFGQCMLAFDDLPADVAEVLVYAVAAGLRREIASAEAASVDSELQRSAAQLLARHDSAAGMDRLVTSLVARLHEADRITDDFLLACAREGEVTLLAEASARIVGIDGGAGFDELMCGDAWRVMTFLRATGAQRATVAGLLASLSDLIGVGDPGAALAYWDQLDGAEAATAMSRLSTHRAYRASLEALGNG